MSIHRPLRFLPLGATIVFITILFTSCPKNDCEDVFCDACPSTHLLIQFQDSNATCPESFNSSATISAFGLGNTMDTLYSYSLTDSCLAAFIIDENVEYHLSAQAGQYNKRIRVLSVEYQPPVENGHSCCLCYPIKHVDFEIGGDTQHVEYPSGAFRNIPFVLSIN